MAIIWGTTFLGIRISVETIPGWFVAGIRQMIAAFLLIFVLIFKKELKWIGWKNLKIQIVFSLLMLVIANGMTTVAEEHITSSLASLISATSPIFVFLGSIFFGLQKFNYRSLIGILLGFSGIVFIFWDGLNDLFNPDFRMGILFIFIAILGWAVGSIFTKKLNYKNENIFLNLFYQFLFAGIFQLLIAFLFTKNYNFENWNLRSSVAVVYLAVFGSVMAYFAFHYGLRKISPTQISILSYINTIIAIFLGWLILDEEISVKFIIAALLIITGVFITNYKPRKNNRNFTLVLKGKLGRN